MNKYRENLLRTLRAKSPDELPSPFDRFWKVFNMLREDPSLRREVISAFSDRIPALRLYLFADLHGYLPKFEFPLLPRANKEIVLFLGDLVDGRHRPEDNPNDAIEETIEFAMNDIIPLLESLKPEKVIFVAGNHDRLDKRNRHKNQMTVIPIFSALVQNAGFDVASGDTVVLSTEFGHIIAEHGHRSTRRSYGRPSQNSIKDRLIYFKDQLNYDPLLYAIGHYHRFIIEQIGKTLFICTPALRQPDDFHFNRSIYLKPTAILVDVFSRDELDIHLISVSPVFTEITALKEVDVR